MENIKEVKIIPCGNNEFICSKEVEDDTLKDMNKKFNKDVKGFTIVARIFEQSREVAYLKTLALQSEDKRMYKLPIEAIDVIESLAYETGLLLEGLENEIYKDEEKEYVYQDMANTTVKHTPEQMEEIMKGIEQGVNVFAYADVHNSPEQMRKMREELLSKSK